MWIGALARVYTETNGRIGETLLHSRLSLLLIDVDCDRIREQFTGILYSIILQKNRFSNYFIQQKFSREKFSWVSTNHELFLTVNYF